MILDNVKKKGDAAVRDYTRRFDGADLEEFRVSKDEMENAAQMIEPKLKEAIQKAAKNILAFHEIQKPPMRMIETTTGVKCWQEICTYRQGWTLYSRRICTFVFHCFNARNSRSNCRRAKRLFSVLLLMKKARFIRPSCLLPGWSKSPESIKLAEFKLSEPWPMEPKPFLGCTKSLAQATHGSQLPNKLYRLTIALSTCLPVLRNWPSWLTNRLILNSSQPICYHKPNTVPIAR